MSGEGMSWKVLDDRPRPGGFARARIATLVVLVATCGAVFWAARVVRDVAVPANGLVRSLRGGDVRDRLAAARALGESAADDVPLAIPALAEAICDDNEEVSLSAVRALADAGMTALRAGARRELIAAEKALNGAMRHRLGAAREEAAIGLANMVLASQPGSPFDYESAAAALALGLRDEDVRVRLAAVRALADVGTKTEITVLPRSLLGAVTRDESADVRAAAASALGSFRSRTSSEVKIPPLIEALRDRDRQVRFDAATALGRIGPVASPAIPSLVALLNDPIVVRSEPNRWESKQSLDPACAAAVTLGRIANGTAAKDEAITALARTLYSDHAWRRNAAVQGLSMVGKEAASAVPDAVAFLAGAYSESGTLGADLQTVRLLGKAAPGSELFGHVMTLLVKLLDSKEGPTRYEAAAALGELGPAASDAVPRLRALLNDPDPFVSQEARRALELIEPPTGKASPRSP
jgi:HEAT repeat protein